MINWYSCRKCLKYRFALYRFESMGDSKNEWKMTINYIIFNTCSTFEMILRKYNKYRYIILLVILLNL